MAHNKDNYQLLKEKLDRFTRKYYLNQIIRGFLYSAGLILLLFIALNVLEYLFYFGKSTRKILVFSFVGISVAALFFWFFLPLLHYFKLGQLISNEKAAQIIGNHFSNVKDKLLNILQLKSQADQGDQRDLIMASVNQKTEEIKPVPFKKAIDLAQNRRNLRYAIPPLLLLLVLLFAAPSVIKEGTNRLIHNNKDFEREAPFSFLVDDENLKAVQYEDFDLIVGVEGEVLPNDMYIDVDNYQYRLKKEDQKTFHYKFRNVQKPVNFRLVAAGFESVNYKLEVLKKPNILGFETQLDYPSYTGRKDEMLLNVGDLVVPLGTKINWLFNAENTDEIAVKFSKEGKLKSIERTSANQFSISKKILQDQTYKLFISNEELPLADSINYTLSVIPDLYPNISVEKFQDSTNQKLLYFLGDASDDYGLFSLSFNYKIKAENGEFGELTKVKLQNPGGKQIQYDHTFDLAELNLQPGQEVAYYFEVYDNDAVNGSKPARTQQMAFSMPTVKEFEEMAAENNEEIKKNLEESVKESKKLQEDTKKLREKLLQEKELDWQNRKELEKLLERQKELQKQLEKAQQNFEENQQNQEEFSEPNAEELEQQEKIQELFEELMDEEMKELMQKIEELLQEMEKDQALEMMQQMEFNEEELEMKLDRLEELYKQLELENELNKQIEALEELAKEQEELSEETKKEETPQEELEEKQEEINEKFEDLEKKMEEIEEKNEELENPKDIGDQDENMEDIKQDLKDSKEALEQMQNNKASQKQKNASQKMQEMADMMALQMEQQEMEQMAEDMQTLRQLLENLVGLSFDQEDLIGDIAKTNVHTPRYTDLVQHQFKLKDDFKLIEDSLQALSKRVIQIESFVTEKVSDVKINMQQSLDQLEERQKTRAAENQQRTMKNVNDLALMLSEVMNQMQQQMSGMMAGAQMCNSPGGQGQGQKPSDKMSKGQKQLGEQMGQGMQKMKDGQGMGSKEFAEMAARQAALRRAVKEAKDKMQQGGGGKGDQAKELQEILDKMNENEIDLVNKRLTNEMLIRQQDILTRLLEHEKAEREQEFEEKRKAERTSAKERKFPPSLEEYIKKREAEIEFYRQASPSLKPYYKFLVEEYYNSLKSKE